MVAYIGIIHKEKNSDFGVSFPDFPGCITAGSSLEDAKEMAQEALQLHVEGMLEDQESIPEPATLDDIMTKRDFRDGVALIVDVSVPARVKRINITMDEALLREIDATTNNRSGVLSSSGNELFASFNF